MDIETGASREHKTGAAIFLFNRDLRITDNKCFTDAINKYEVVYPIFIFTPEQIIKNPYYNPRSILFMCGLLKELYGTTPLCFFKGHTIDILTQLIHKYNIKAIFNNTDVSPYAQKRTADIAKLCKNNNAELIEGKDIFYGRDTPKLTKSDGRPYLKFTPFYNNAVNKVIKQTPLRTPNLSKAKNIIKNRGINILESVAADAKKKIKNSAYNNAGTLIFAPSRQSALSLLNKFINNGLTYSKTRDEPALNATTHLSAYLHFGAVSPIEVADKLKGTKNYKDIVKQLLWREFYIYIIWMQHTDYSKDSRTIQKNNKIKWRTAPNDFKHWCNGTTGCPIVDAGMRELNQTGYMQNRLRMIVAMYLIFHLQIDWRLGEKYFAQNLIDYDYCNNLGGWLWSASWEVHSNEYYRAFSMSSQMKRFDKDALYVKKWLPELSDVPTKYLYDWSANYKKYKAVDNSININYLPIIDDMNKARAAGINKYK